MSFAIVSVRVTSATLAALRGRTRQIAEHFGLDTLQTTRFVTAVSEIARNAVHFATEGTVAFSFQETRNAAEPQHLVAVVSDQGPGIAAEEIARVLAGRPNARGEVPMGIAGSRRLVDELQIASAPGKGTAVTLRMALPKLAAPLTRADLAARIEEFTRQKPRTPLEELEQQNREMLGTLQELRLRQQALEQADERKNQFLMTLAHELRNPLSTLHMMLEIMRRNLRIEPEDLGRRRDAMARQTDQMIKLVEDLVDVSRVSQGKVELDRHPVEVVELVEQALEMTGSALASKQHEVAFERPAGELWIDGDPARLKQVLCNLLQNAARYTPAGGAISVQVAQRERWAEVAVVDNGVGIGAEALPHIFDLFVQGSAGPSPGGLGVGLTLVRKLVESHGGQVSASSEGEGLGSRFVVRLPLR